MTTLEQTHRRVASCARCPASLVKHEWPPISFFGEVDQARIWTISINPSAREFTDQAGIELTGERQRFALVRDFPNCSIREDLTGQQADQVVEMQRSVFVRAPYRNYFNSLGRFLLRIYEANAAEPLAPFIDGIEQGGEILKVCHMDIVKCATARPWSDLGGADQQSLVANCSPYIEQQLEGSDEVRILLINGRTALDVCLAVLHDFGLRSATTTVRLATTTSQLTYGDLRIGGKPLRAIAWSSNVVNQQLRAEDISLLAEAVRGVL